jgi:hypothetical protein
MSMNVDRVDGLAKRAATRRTFGLGLVAALAAAARVRLVAADDAPRLIVLAPAGAGPKLSAIGVEDVTATTAAITWSTSEAAGNAFEGFARFGDAAHPDRDVVDLVDTGQSRAPLTS